MNFCFKAKNQTPKTLITNCTWYKQKHGFPDLLLYLGMCVSYQTLYIKVYSSYVMVQHNNVYLSRYTVIIRFTVHMWFNIMCTILDILRFTVHTWFNITMCYHSSYILRFTVHTEYSILFIILILAYIPVQIVL